MLKISFAKGLMLAGSAAAMVLTAVPVQAQLEQALSTAQQSTRNSQQAQKQVDAADDRASSAKREYVAVLQQKDNVELFVKQQDIYLQSQQGELDSLRFQLGTVEQIKQGMAPMMLRMVVELEDAVRADLPFRMDERLSRIERVKAYMADPDVSPAEQYRQILNAYKIEVNYGMGIDSYEGAHPTDAGQYVNFLRYGRLSLMYMTKDESEIGRYNMESGEWDVLDGAEAISVRRAIRVALGEAAPEMLSAPVVMGQ